MGKGDVMGDERTDGNNHQVDDHVIVLGLQAYQYTRETGHDDETIVELSYADFVVIACQQEMNGTSNRQDHKKCQEQCLLEGQSGIIGLHDEVEGMAHFFYPGY